jgi:hypothetical protein
MDGQMIVVVMLVATAAVYLIRRSWRTWTGKKAGCGSGCACGKPTQQRGGLIPSAELTLRQLPHPR